MAAAAAAAAEARTSYMLGVRVALVAAACGVVVCVLVLAAMHVSPRRGAATAAPPGRPAPEPRTPGRAWALQQPTAGGAASFWVLRDQPGWRRARAADACLRARQTHRLALDRYAAMPEATRARVASAVGRLPATDRLVRWVQAPGAGEAPGSVRHEPRPDRGDPNWMQARGAAAFAMVDADAGPDAARDAVARALGGLFDTGLQAAQVAYLCAEPA